jgi:hypothetical protein
MELNNKNLIICSPSSNENFYNLSLFYHINKIMSIYFLIFFILVNLFSNTRYDFYSLQGDIRMAPQNPLLNPEQPLNPFLQEIPDPSNPTPFGNTTPVTPPIGIEVPDSVKVRQSQQVAEAKAAIPNILPEDAVTPSLPEQPLTTPIETTLIDSVTRDEGDVTPKHQRFFDKLPKKEGGSNPYNLIPEKIPRLLESTGIANTREGHELATILTSGTEEQRQAILNNPYISSALADLKYEALKESTKKSLGGREVPDEVMDRMIMNYWEDGLSDTAKKIFTSGLMEKEHEAYSQERFEKLGSVRIDPTTKKAYPPLIVNDKNIGERANLNIQDLRQIPAATVMRNTREYTNTLIDSPEFKSKLGVYAGTDIIKPTGTGNIAFDVKGVASPEQVLTSDGGVSQMYSTEYTKLSSSLGATSHEEVNAILEQVKKNEGGYILNPYVLPEAMGNSGITISAGIDLGRMEPRELKARIGSNEELYNKLVPFTALFSRKPLTRQQAAAVLQDSMDNGTFPVLTPEEAAFMSIRDMNYRLEDMGDIDGLSTPALTILLDISVQHGIGGARGITPHIRNAYQNVDKPEVFNAHLDEAINKVSNLSGAPTWNAARTRQRVNTLQNLKQGLPKKP